jgi:hypothetical protein
MTDKEFGGMITDVQVISAWVKIQIDALPGKIFGWRMTNFIDKPRPEIGKRIKVVASPGRLNDYDVQRLISITDAGSTEVQQAVQTEVGKSVDIDVGKAVSTEITPDPTTLPLPSSMATLEQLAERILKLKVEWKERFASDMLEFKWTVGREISVSRGKQEPATFRDLEERTGIDHVELFRCVKFFEKYPSRGYELKAWRDLRAELPAGKEPVTESKSAPFVDGRNPWVCPECGVKFWHLHNPNGGHGLREVEGA